MAIISCPVTLVLSPPCIPHCEDQEAHHQAQKVPELLGAMNDAADETNISKRGLKLVTLQKIRSLC
jgi:hypothetical protein